MSHAQKAAPPKASVITDEVRSQFISGLWRSPLGRMFDEYLFGNSKPAQVPQLARGLVNRVFAQPDMVANRIVALQLLTENIYVTSRMTTDVSQRILILEGSVSERRLWRSHSMEVEVARDAVPFILFSLPFGSPLLRNEATELLKRISSRIQFWRGSAADGLEGSVAWRRILSSEILQGYGFYMSGQFFLNTYGPFSTIYYFSATYFFNSTYDPHLSYSAILSGDDLLSDSLFKP